MDAQPASDFKELFTHVIGDMAKALSQRNGEPEQRQFARCRAAVRMIMGFMPRDVIEAMLAGHCVMFHELIVDTVQHTLLGEIDTMRRATRSGIVAMDKSFRGNLERLGHYQLRPSTGRRDTPGIEVGNVAAESVAEENRDSSLEMAVRAEFQAAQMRAAAGDATDAQGNDALVGAVEPGHDERRQSEQAEALPAGPLANDFPDQTVRVELRTDAGAPAQPGTLVFTPSAAAIAACKANPEAMAALEAGDPERFARALGLDQPSEGFLAAAAAPGSPFSKEFGAEKREGARAFPSHRPPEAGASQTGVRGKSRVTG